MRTRPSFACFFILGFVALFCGCDSVRDVSHDPHYPTDYKVGVVYRAKQPFVFESGRLWPTDTAIASIPHSITEFERGGKERWPNVAGFMEAGSTVKIEAILLNYSFEMGRWMTVTGRIQDGRFAGQTVELGLISQENPFPRKAMILFVDTNYLDRIATP